MKPYNKLIKQNPEKDEYRTHSSKPRERNEMTHEEESVYFLHRHIEESFGEIFDNFLLEDVKWLEEQEGVRPIGILEDTNLLILFPPFCDRAAGNVVQFPKGN